MFNINSYLDKFKRIEPPGDTVKTASIAVISEVIGVEIAKNEMAVQNGILFLSIPSAIKNEIYMSKKRIIEKINETLKTNELKDIR